MTPETTPERLPEGPERPWIRKNRLVRCPLCGRRLGHDKNAVTSENGWVYRSRQCSGCLAVLHTKQPPEEITGVSA